ncbi:MAG: galactose oxidase-like domain-containing protein [Actinomycetota bacterium]
MRKPLRLGVAFAAAISTVLGTPGSPFAAAGDAPACANAATEGCFDAPFSENGDFDAAAPNTIEEAGRYPTAASAVVLPDGKVLYWDGLSDIQNAQFATVFLPDALETKDRSRILDLGDDYTDAPLISEPAVNPTGGGDNLFCADQRLLSDGRLLATGGTLYTYQNDFEGTALEDNPTGYSGMGSELFGSQHTRVFTADGGGAWERVGDMRWRRWYPTLVTLPDGKLFVAGGVSKLVYNTSLANTPDGEASDVLPRNVVQTEVFDPITDTWSDNPDTANKSLPLFARMHLAPTGEIVFTANGQQFNPMGQDVDELSWNNQAAFDPDTNTWRDIGVGPLAARSGAAESLLRLEPNDEGDYDTARVLMAGGTLGVSPGTYLAHNKTEILTLTDANEDGKVEASTELGPDLNNSRWFSTAVTLPTGDVLAFNGGTLDDVIAPGSAKAVRQVEMFDGQSWTPLASGARDRVYHNSAILLKDGSILVGGHSPINWGYGSAQPDTDDLSGGLMNNNLRDPSFERFFPPYLYAGERPVISQVSSNALANGQPFSVELDSGSPDAAELVLSRLPAQTHVTDADARTIKLDAIGTNHYYNATVPGSTIVPPGYYYLFAISADGVPSVASIVNIS